MIASAAGPAMHLSQYGDLLLAFALASLIGLERELRQHSAGMRTHTLVGLASALIMLVSKYGFSDVIAANHVVLDPSRVAAQIVSGIGFIGGGLIFVRRDAVRGLTTAATIWVASGVGMACGAGLPLLAVATTSGHFIVVYAYPPLTRLLHQAVRVPLQVRVDYRDGEGVLRRVMMETTARGFAVSEVAAQRGSAGSADGRGSRRDREDVDEPAGVRVVSLVLRIIGKGSLTDLAAALSEVDGVLAVNAGAMDDDDE
ncbi:MAG TPA: MgtC/SapB family protein [Mycobacteriales bacterium]|jgi:putative Mg2+ transporter-C (MgtC) family protein|nr:MgtC/SapB family protein [Mycobacteriales bacterium]